MNEFQLKRIDTDEELGLWGCGKCGTVYVARDIAVNCCICSECGEPIGDDDFYGRRGSATHETCWRERSRGVEGRRMKNAEKLDSWDGWVWRDVAGYNHGYFPSVDEFQEWWEGDRDEPLPEFVFVCKPNRVLVDGADILEDATYGAINDRGWEDMDVDDLSGVKEFRAACEAFSVANKDVVSYDVDYTRAVRVSTSGGIS